MLLAEYKRYLEDLKQKALSGGRFAFVVYLLFFLGSLLYFYIPTAIPLNKVSPTHYCALDSREFEVCGPKEYCARLPGERKLESAISTWAFDFDLTCNGEEAIDFVIVAHYAGSLLYTVFLGMLQEQIGRVSALKLESAAVLVILMSFLVVSDIYFFVVLVLLLQLFNGFRLLLTIYSKEVLTEEHFNVSVGFTNTSYAAAGFVQLFVMSTFKDWKASHLCFMGFVGVVAAGIVLIYPESPEYLLCVGKTAEAKESIRQISKFSNGTNDIEAELEHFEARVAQMAQENTKSLTFSELYGIITSDSSVLKAFAINCALLGEIRIVLNGIFMQINIFSQEAYFWSGVLLASDLLGNLLGGFVVNWLGVRRTLSLTLLFCAIFSYLNVLLQGTSLIGANMTVLLFITAISLTSGISFSMETVDKRYSGTLFTYAMAFSQIYNSLIPWIMSSLNWYLLHGTILIGLYLSVRNK